MNNIDLAETFGMSAFRRGLESGAFSLEYQPYFRDDMEGTFNLEALLRWRRPDGEAYLAEHFMPIVGRDPEAAVAVDRLVLSQAVSQTERMMAIKLGRFQLAVNIASWATENLVQDMVESIRREKPGLISSLIFECSWQLFSGSTKEVRNTMLDLAKMEVLIGLDNCCILDDALIDLSKGIFFHSIKIGFSDLKKMMEAGHSSSIKKRKKQLEKFGCELVVVGVGADHDLDLMRKLGFKSFQGFRYKSPISGGDALDFFRLLERSKQASW